jgi:hypothetical protein
MTSMDQRSKAALSLNPSVVQPNLMHSASPSREAVLFSLH